MSTRTALTLAVIGYGQISFWLGVYAGRTWPHLSQWLGVS